MGRYYLAVDIGASGGRHILGELKNGKLVLTEIYRFENGMERKNGKLCWNTEHLFSEIRNGLRKCAESGKKPFSMGIDTWGVDYVLLDRENKIIGDTFGYRDSRTEGMDEKVYAKIPEKELYERTGIQKQIFNTVFQLMSVKETAPEELAGAETFLMLPDYFHFLLTGKKASEYTNATTTGMVNVKTKTWDREIIQKLGFPEKIFLPLSLPGTELGELRPEITEETGVSCKVILPATHDTGSAVMAVPAQGDDTLYISSGTWSLMGVESRKAVCTEQGRMENFTNEGGYEYRYRILKNIMGLWMIQSVRHELKDRYSFAELCSMAEKEKAFPTRVDVNDKSFYAPESMIGAIRAYAKRTGQEVPETEGQISAVIYESLSGSYARTLEETERLTGKHYNAVHIVGGGSHADYLNRLTAEKCGRTVYAGPGEATAVGNLISQMIKAGELKNLNDARKCVFESFDIRTYRP
jgi:rhamnulokinase